MAAKAETALPSWLDGTYVGFGAGYTGFGYSNRDLGGGFAATGFENPRVGLNAYAGHELSDKLSLQLGLMRPIKWVYVNGIQGPADRQSVWVSVFHLALRPKLRLSEKLELYGLAGLGLVSRNGFTISGVDAVASEDILTLFGGGGLSYALGERLRWNAGVEGTAARRGRRQPGTLYLNSGLSWRFKGSGEAYRKAGGAKFPERVARIGGFSRSIVDADPTKYVSVGYLPIFFDAKVKAKEGLWGSYEVDVLHTDKRVQLTLGISVAQYRSDVSDTAFEAYSVYPSLQWWFLRTGPADVYFKYSLAGPAYLTRRNLDHQDLGGHISFQDLLGFGVSFGEKRDWDALLTLVHYSNGNLFPKNPGIQVPLVLCLGRAF